LYNNEGFDSTYGFNNSNNNYQLLGRDRSGEPHTLDVGLGYPSLKTPAPGVTSMNSETLGGKGVFRQLSFNIQCHDKYQLEYLTPYFLTPGITVLVEWGWDDMDQKGSDLLVDLDPENDKIPELINSWDEWEYKRCRSCGKYDIFLGIVDKFGYTLESNNSFNCDISLKSVSEQIYAYETAQEQTYKQSKDSDKKQITKDFSSFLEYHIGNVEQQEFYINRGSTEETSVKNEKEKISKYIPYRKEYVNNHISAFTRESFNRFDLTLDDKNIPKDKKWISFGLFIDLINRWSSRTHKNKGGTNGIRDALVFDISSSDICGHPNIKSISEDVLIPNSATPCWAYEGDRISDMVNNVKGTGIFRSKNTKYLDEADAALDKLKESLVSAADGTKEIYDVENFNVARFDLAKILTGRGARDETDITFPLYTPYYGGYAGKLSSIFISDSMIKKAFANKQTVRKMVQEILDKMSAAASGIWEFSIVDESYSVMSIIDTNYPGTDKKNGGIIGVDKLIEKLYTFSSLDSNSVISGVDFKADLPAVVALQTLFENPDSLTSNPDFFRSPVKTRDGTRVAVEDIYSRFSGNNRDVEIGAKVNNGIYTNSSTDCLMLEVNPKSTTKGDFTLRLTEPNEEIARSGMLRDTSPKNTTVYNRVVPGITIGFETLGISGIRFMDCFMIDSLPFPYDTEVIFQVKNVKHVLKGNDWKTVVEAALRPSPKLVGATVE